MTTTQRWTMIAAILGSAIVFIDGTIVSIALPRIGEELPATLIGVLEGQAYVVSGYLATLAALLILAGALADFHGRRRIFAMGLVGFGITSVLCGLAPNLEFLALFRILQGAAGALLVPGSMSIITTTFEGAARGRAFGLWAASTSAAVGLGPVVGGILVEEVSWRAAFLVNVPIVSVAMYATVRYVAESRDEEATGRFDWVGAVVGVLAVGGLAFGAIRGQDQQWTDPVAYVALAVGAISAVAFPFLMARRERPLVPLELFRSRGFAVINLSTLLIWGALYVTIWFQSLFLQGPLRYTALAAAIVGLPTTILIASLSTRVGAAAARIGARPFLTVGPLVMAAGLAWFARVPVTSTSWAARLGDATSLVPPVSTVIDILPATALFGLGIALVVAPLTSTLMASVPVRNAGVASAINNAVSRVGQPLLAAVIFIVITGTFYATLGERVPGLDPSSPEIRAVVEPLNEPPATVSPEIREAARQASVEAFRLAVLVASALLVAGAAVNFVGLREVRLSGGRTGAPSGAQPAGVDGANADRPR